MSSLTICTMVWRLSKPWSARGVEHSHLGHARQPPAGEGEQRDRGAGALVGRSGRQILVGDTGIEAAGEMGRLLAADRQRRGADGIEPVNTRGQYGGHWTPSRSALVPGRDVTSDHDNLTTEIGVAESAHHILCFGGCPDAG